MNEEAVETPETDLGIEQVRISSIILDQRFRKDMGDIKGLASSIEKLGLLQPIVITKKRRLVAGGRRLAAHRHLGLEFISARIIDFKSIIEAEDAENTVRKDFTRGERLSIARAIKNENQKMNDCTIAQAAGFKNRDEMTRTQKTFDSGSPKLKEAVESGSVSVSAGAELSSLPKDEQDKILEAGTVAEAVKEIKQRRQKQICLNSVQVGGFTFNTIINREKELDIEFALTMLRKEIEIELEKVEARGVNWRRNETK